jgi:hypothetical protein
MTGLPHHRCSRRGGVAPAATKAKNDRHQPVIGDPGSGTEPRNVMFLASGVAAFAECVKCHRKIVRNATAFVEVLGKDTSSSHRAGDPGVLAGQVSRPFSFSIRAEGGKRIVVPRRVIDDECLCFGCVVTKLAACAANTEE